MGAIILTTKQRSFQERVSAGPELAALSERFIDAARLLELSSPAALMPANGAPFRRPAELELRATVSAAHRAGMVHRLRPFALSDEPLFVPRYLNATRRENSGQVLEAATLMIRDAFLVRKSGIALKANTPSRQVEFERQWQDYANAYEYHQDTSKREKLAAELGNQVAAEFVFLWGLLAKVRTVLAMRGLALLMAGRADAFEVDLTEVDLDARPAA